MILICTQRSISLFHVRKFALVASNLDGDTMVVRTRT